MNNYNTRPPRKGVIVFASVVFLSIFVIAILDAYEQKAQALGHSVHLSPTSANYGTVSSAPVTVAVPMRSTAPLLSGGTIRSYAYSGHSSMPKTSGTSGSSFKIHTTSSASVHSYGSGGGGGGSVGAGGGSSSSSSRGIHSSGISVSVPTLALATPRPSMTTSYNDGGVMRKSKPTTDGTEDGQWSDNGAGDGEWYRWDDWAGEWVTPESGDLRYDNGNYFKYDGSGWIQVDDQGNPTNPTPLGDMPWLWMIILLGAYACTRYIHKKKTA